MEFREYKNTDLHAVMDLFYVTVHEVNKNDYSEEQLDAIAPKNANEYHWEKSLEKNHTIVVEEDDKLIAFGNIGKTGYLDRLYVHPDYLRKGIASKLVEELEEYAKKHGSHVINVTSSITSKAFFESKGYAVIEEQINERRGERLLRYLMEKKI
ncbi:GNAT family N-acetyltransferase [Catenibacterium sp.]|uniref:GNAT family N-acetyltransferase n=1 Tax=Catenibacterium sp. TaxID=2049022 RepID=UPI002E75AD2C|nr:GNAT family N-acetyltransferase [Catenibacterium sp.]MEE0490777.1 GNAT family N-acetyltransferase [Catenibacterium sp.]